MKRLLFITGFMFLIAVVASVLTPATPSVAQSEFKKVLKNKYPMQNVTCHTCHMRGKNVPKKQQAAFNENKKSFRNDFGQEFDKLLKGKDISKRLKAAKKKKQANRKQFEKVKKQIIDEFEAALEEVEKVASPEGPTYGELLKKGKLSDG